MTPPSPAQSPAPAADSRLDQLRAWLATHGGRHAPASADASFRRYFRLASGTEPGGTAIAVDAPPPEKCREFVQIAGLLAAAGLHAPRVLETDLEAGFMLVSDLGTATYIGALDPADTAAAKPLLRAAIDALVRWQLSSREGDYYLTGHLIDRGTLGALMDRRAPFLIADSDQADITMDGEEALCVSLFGHVFGFANKVALDLGGSRRAIAIAIVASPPG
ncbi:MAG: hypothetical protein VB141_07050, partial [Burkholderia gladioli]